MEGHDIFRLLAALCFVLALMGGLTIILKKMGLANTSVTPKNRERRLRIIETLNLDPRRRLVLIQRDNAEHLVILGGTSETVIETNINAAHPHEDQQS